MRPDLGALSLEIVLLAQRGERNACNEVFSVLRKDGLQTLQAWDVPEGQREDILHDALTKFWQVGLDRFDPRKGTSLGALFRSYLWNIWQHARRGEGHRRQWEKVVAPPDSAPGRDAPPPETAAAREADALVAELGGFLRESSLEPWEVRVWELGLADFKYLAIQAALTEEFGFAPSQKVLTEVIDFRVPRALASPQALLDLKAHVPLLITEAERRRQQRGQIGWCRGILDVLLAGLEDRRLGGPQAELHLRALHLRAQIALDRREKVVREEVLRAMSHRLADVSKPCRGFWAVRHEHTQGRAFHNDHDYVGALRWYESTQKSAPGSKPDGTLLRDYGSALRGAGRYDESLQMLRRAADWFLHGGDYFQAARCDSLRWRSAVELARRGGPGSVAECRDRLQALENESPGLKETANPLVHTQHRLGYLAALAATPADLDEAVAEALRVAKIIDNNNYHRQKFELVELCAEYHLPDDLLRRLGPVPRPRRSRRQKT